MEIVKFMQIGRQINMDEIKQISLRKIADEILLGGRQAVEEFNYGDYTKEELEFIRQEIDRKNTQDLDKFMQNLENKEHK